LCCESVDKTLEDAFAKYGLPEIVDTDQGSIVFTDAVLSRGIALSMDGNGNGRGAA
jgi:putative transposase